MRGLGAGLSVQADPNDRRLFARSQSDTLARLVARILGGLLETSVVAENRAGANGMIGVALTVQAPPDGYTLGLAGGGPLTLARVVDSSVRFDVQRDLVPLARIARVPLVLAARADLPARDTGRAAPLLSEAERALVGLEGWILRLR